MPRTKFLPLKWFDNIYRILDHGNILITLRNLFEIHMNHMIWYCTISRKYGTRIFMTRKLNWNTWFIHFELETKKYKTYFCKEKIHYPNEFGKLRVRWFSKMKKSSFFKADLTDPSQIFDAHLLEYTDLSPSRFHFQWVLYQDHVLSQMVL